MNRNLLPDKKLTFEIIKYFYIFLFFFYFLPTLLFSTKIVILGKTLSFSLSLVLNIILALLVFIIYILIRCFKKIGFYLAVCFHFFFLINFLFFFLRGQLLFFIKGAKKAAIIFPSYFFVISGIIINGVIICLLFSILWDWKIKNK